MTARNASKHLKQIKRLNSITVSTIDRYQGSENDILIISLVRSNDHHSIGFLAQRARRVVAQSRARQGMYFVGDRETFSSNEYWNELANGMDERGRCGNLIPLCCPKHPDICRPCLQADGQNLELMRDGICNAPCNFKMPCGLHVCPRPCHGNIDTDRDAHLICHAEVKDECSMGHTIKRKCFQQPSDVTCNVCRKLERERKRLEQEHLALIREQQEKQVAEIIAKEKQSWNDDPIGHSDGFHFTAVSRPTAQALQRCLKTDGKLLGTGRDVKEAGSYTRLVFNQAWKITHPGRLASFVARKQLIENECRRLKAKKIPVPRRRSSLPRTFDENSLDSDVNEQYLLHGTAPELLINVIAAGVNERYSKVAAYGNGNYLADDAGEVKGRQVPAPRTPRAPPTLNPAPRQVRSIRHA